MVYYKYITKKAQSTNPINCTCKFLRLWIGLRIAGRVADRIADRVADQIVCGLKSPKLRIRWQIGLRIGLWIGYVADGCRIGGKNSPGCWLIRTLTDRMIGQSVSFDMMRIESACGLRIPIRNPSFDMNEMVEGKSRLICLLITFALHLTTRFVIK